METSRIAPITPTVSRSVDSRATGARAPGLRLNTSRQTRGRSTGGSYDLRVVSGFVTGKVAERIWLVGRADRHLDADPGYAAGAAPGRPYLPIEASVANTFLLAGVEFVARENVAFTPNVEAVVYDDPDGGGPAPVDDIVGRVTFMFKY